MLKVYVYITNFPVAHELQALILHTCGAHYLHDAVLAVSVIHFDSHHPAGRGVFHGSESRSAFLLGEAKERQWHCWHLALPVEAAACRVGSGRLQRWQFPPFISVCTCLHQAHLPISKFLSSLSLLLLLLLLRLLPSTSLLVFHLGIVFRINLPPFLLTFSRPQPMPVRP
ncbi:hypothetical protein DER44DRAFT_55710 [Fusarium oxysporum]|nr:hypothetical protein DER44DRAFT_55710 [Fusarium oxysporum]